MQAYLIKISRLYNGFILGVIILVGIATLLADVPKLKRSKLDKEVKLATGIGLVYIFGGLISFIALKIFL